MASVPNADTNDRVNLVYETKIGDKSEMVELPFKVLVLGDFTLDERSEYFDDQLPIILTQESHNIDVIFKQLKPGLKIKIANKIQQDDSELFVELSFTSLADFTPPQVLKNISWMGKLVAFTDTLAQVTDTDTLQLDEEDKAFIEKVLNAEDITLQELQQNSQNYGWVIASIEKRICDQLDEIIHHERFIAMESLWRSLQFLTERTEFNENCEIAVINVSKQGLIEDFEDVPEITLSKYYQIVYSEEYGQFGGRPYGAVISDFKFGPKAQDIKCLQQLASVSAVSHAPFIAAASAELFDIDSFSRFSRLRDIAAIYTQPAYIKWNAFRQSSDSRYVGLTLPFFLLRESHNTEIGGLRYVEKVSKKDTDLLWGNASFAFATRLMDSFAKYRWCLNCTGQSGGQVQGLNMKDGKIATQFILTDRRESDVVEHGFIPLSVHKGDDTSTFYSAYSTHTVIAEESNNGEDLSARLSSQLPYLMIVSRISQYLKIMQREHLGSWRNRRDLDQQLNKWLSQYVSDMDNPAAGVRARRPLRRAEVKVRELEGKQDWFVTRIQVTPHLKFMGSSFELSETSKMEKN